MSPTDSQPHPLDPLQPNEVRRATKILLKHVSLRSSDVRFKIIDLLEPPKESILTFLENGVAPPRKTRIYYNRKGTPNMIVAVANLSDDLVEKNDPVPGAQGPVDWTEYDIINNACNNHPDVLAEVAKLKLPPGMKVANDPWAYGTDDENENRRLFQCYLYAVVNDDPQANHYSLPLPLAPVFDADTFELVDLQKLPTGVDATVDDETQPWQPAKPIEYSADVLGPRYFRQDLKPLQVVQPEGPSFNITGRQVSWQKWTFQLGWNLREGPVLHHVRYDGRPLFYRVSMSEMTVPYGDPRSPYHRKQAFDLGDSGFGLTSNSLKLGCDCLGHIAYFDGVRVNSSGDPVVMENVVCMHEVDQGIGWKHTNWRNNKASMIRDRQLVVQCTATVANYEYILAFILDQAANLHIEVRATGIVSTMPIRQGLKSPWGTVVAPGVLACNHQHLFCLRVDPMLDGARKNTIIYDDCIPVRNEPDLDPSGCAFRVHTTRVEKAGSYDLDLIKNRTFKIINDSVINPVSGSPVGYKLHTVPSQMLMMDPSTFNYRRGIFSSKPIWVTRYQDDELWAAGEFTNQSKEDTGLALWTARGDNVENEDVVLWHNFGITHVTRPEDFPVMSTEKMMVSLKPTSFFTSNPSNDVPRSSQAQNRSTACHTHL